MKDFTTVPPTVRGLVSRQLRHADVEQQHLGPEIGFRRDGFLAVVGDAHVVAAHLQQHGEAVGGVGVVVDDEDAPRHRALPRFTYRISASSLSTYCAACAT